MKILFASDIHGSLSDMETLLKRIKEEKPDFIMFLGDFCGYSENEIFGEAFGKITFPYSYLRGNCDNGEVLTRHGLCAEAYTCVEKFGEKRVFGTHGHLYIYGGLPVGMEKGDIFVSGHTHVPVIFYRDGITVINCGSMARPRMSETKTYACIERNKAYIKNGETGEIVKEAEII
ncbi:MAG: YfcE family phosphodiesterase [Christensenellales bacterium]